MIERTDLSFPVYEKLKSMILQNELKPGEKLLQEKLAQQLGVSRTPLLKAMQMLEFDFLVESIPRRGLYVKKLSVKELHDIYDVREGIECVAIRLTTQCITSERFNELQKIWSQFNSKKGIDLNEYTRADEKFHSLLLEYSENNILKKTYNLSLIQARILQTGLMRAPEETLSEHLAMIQAIKEGDYEKAEMEMKNHLRKSKEMIVKKIK